MQKTKFYNITIFLNIFADLVSHTIFFSKKTNKWTFKKSTKKQITTL